MPLPDSGISFGILKVGEKIPANDGHACARLHSLALKCFGNMRDGSSTGTRARVWSTKKDSSFIERTASFAVMPFPFGTSLNHANHT